MPGAYRYRVTVLRVTSYPPPTPRCRLQLPLAAQARRDAPGKGSCFDQHLARRLRLRRELLYGVSRGVFSSFAI